MSDDSFTVPHTLLEKALQIHGSHLGSFWIKPKPADNISQRDFLGYTTSNNNTCVEYPKRPIQLAKIVHETAVIWRESKADPMVANQFASGTEISCPILDSHGNPQTTPYCYVVEVKRSPLALHKRLRRTLIWLRESCFLLLNVSRVQSTNQLKARTTCSSTSQFIIHSLFIRQL